MSARFPHFGRSPAAFSLVEVMISLGILSFCLISILGLVSTGLRVTQDNKEQLEAGQSLATLCASLRGARATNGTDFRAAPPFQDLAWRLGGPRVEFVCWQGEDGSVSSSPSAVGGSRVLAISLLPSSTPDSPVTASVTVAWPGSVAKLAGWTGGTDRPQSPDLEKVSGWIGSPVVFFPRP